MKFIIKQYLKMFMQGVFLPTVYFMYCRQPINERLVIFADAHHDSLPFSMVQMHRAVKREKFEVFDYIKDYSKMSFVTQLFSMVSFMKLYSRARYVFICDYFLPVASCRKKDGTTVIQLWHSGGLLKTFGYDTLDDIPCCYKLNPYRNYDLVTVSAKCCESVLSRAMRLPPGVVRATGISRSDCYFDHNYIQKCRENFYRQYPLAVNKKVILWAPTFRGNAAAPFLKGISDILQLQTALGENYLILIKAHPHIDKQQVVSNCTIPSEKLLPVIDLLITDYSSILFDYIIFEKPFVLFAPDYEEYKQKRGFYIEYRSLPGPIVMDGSGLAEVIKRELVNPDRTLLAQCREYHMGSCDGYATQRILDQITKQKRVDK
ncbi:MAG: CDP-glycerol glycerophosphotransferase family protein [Clostridium sp.]|nr:CDP-glycerol glycerophosphotransferase family protein [Clostridium sp.]